ncbi:MAG: phospho-sugar mutase [Oscillospiraceae bacterium]|nr:phospho-sugar mutase [Oscillospiraceae bacterium]MBQ3952353.1 phospho-sugar mutase [Oscillospiraceae bacterium]
MDFMKEYEKWLTSPCTSEEEKTELRAIRGDAKEIESRFQSLLSFGTAGLRGTMGAGTYRMNVHVIRHATQAFAEVVAAEGEEAKKAGVAICYDCRNNGDVFAREAASVMAANGINVRLFDDMRPTPELSFAVREYHCTAGINVTASHNPKEYNGYKVYWSDGAQLPPKHAAEVAAKMEELDIFTAPKTMDFEEAKKAGLITMMGAETDERFLSEVMAMVNDYESVAKAADTFKMVYTPFHGTGRILIPEALHRLGVKHLYCEPKQMVKDGNFSTVVSPNPENPEGFYLSVDLANEVGADFILGSDPDADRVGLMIRDHDGKFIPLTGNQTGVLLFDYLIGALRRAGKMPEKPVGIKTIVTTSMFNAVAEKNGIAHYDTFTGFKFIAEKKNALEGSGEGSVIFAYEESYGYMFGDYVRDKDAVTAAVLMAEMAAYYHLNGIKLIDALDACYEKYGAYAEKTINLVMPGLDGQKKMKKLMVDLRENTPKAIAGVAVKTLRDYLPGTETDLETGAVTKMELSESNVLSFILADGTVILVRPSGTEPKVKVYILAHGENLEATRAQVPEYVKWANSLAE